MKLTTEARNRIKDEHFALPGRRYPIHDISHARSALSRISQYGTPEEKARVRAAVARRFPQVGKNKQAAAVTVPMVVGGAAALGVGANLLTNAIVRMLRKTRPPKLKPLAKATQGIQAFETRQIASGIRQGVSGTKRSKPLNTSDIVVTPSLNLADRLGRRLGTQLRAMPERKRVKRLNQLHDIVVKHPELKDSPLLRSLPSGIRKAVEDGIPKAGNLERLTTADKITPSAVGFGQGFFKPHSFVLSAINTAKVRGAQSKMGRKFLAKKYQKGLEGKESKGILPFLGDVAFSPVIRDVQNLGYAVRQVGMKSKKDAARLSRLLDLPTGRV